MSVEETFERDVATVEQLRAITLRMADEVAVRLEREARGASTVTLKLRYPDFAIATRSQTSPAPFSGPDEIGRLALIALDRALALQTAAAGAAHRRRRGEAGRRRAAAAAAALAGPDRGPAAARLRAQDGTGPGSARACEVSCVRRAAPAA